MERRDFVRKAALTAAGGGLLSACGAAEEAPAGAPGVQTRRNVRWRLISSYPRSLDALYGVVDGLAARVAALTGDRFQIRGYPAGELVPPNEVLTAVQNGTVQMGHSAAYYYVGKNPAFAFDTCVPFGLTARQQNAWLYRGGGLELMRELYADFNIVNFPGGNTGAQMGGWFRREINSLADLRGLKMRIPGLGGEVMDALGVTPQLLPGGELYPALERGAIDAVEWVGPYDDEKLGLHQIAPYYYYPGWWEPGPTVSFMINRQAWEGLPPEYQEVLATAAAEMNQQMLATYDARNQEAFVRLIDGGARLRRFPDDVMRAAEQQSFDIMERRAAADAAYRKVYEAFKQWRDASLRWFGTNEHAYAAYVYRDAGPA